LTTPAILVLADGSEFHGISVGVKGQTVGEVVFNTAMTGYQEILTDPSYAQQIVTLTYPHIGNVGTNAEDFESGRVWASGLVIRDLPLTASNWRSEQSLPEFLQAQQVVAIAEVDTRELTRKLREQGAMHGCIMAGSLDADAALKAAKAFGGLTGKDVASEVSTTQTYPWTEGTWTGTQGFQQPPKGQKHVVVYDFGVKRNIMRLLVDRGCRLTVLPAKTPPTEALAYRPDGIFLSNGPGDPAACDEAISAIKAFLDKGIPLFGICLGHQLLALACGAKTTKMKFGHHGANHPVLDLDSKRVFITSQNHGFAVDEDSLPATLQATHRSLFDQSLQGIAHQDKPAFGFQGHPEASPGPHDIHELFDRFMASMAD